MRNIIKLFDKITIVGSKINTLSKIDYKSFWIFIFFIQFLKEIMRIAQY